MTLISKNRLNLLIVGINYAPEQSGIAPYTTGIAEHMNAQGTNVTVLTAIPSYPLWQVFEAYRGKLRSRRVENGVNVQRYRTYVPKQQSVVRRAGYEVAFLANAGSHGRLRNPPDLVVGVVPSLSGGILARLEAARYHCPYAVVVQDLMAMAARQSGIGGGNAAAGITELLERWVLRRATRIGIISERFRPHIERMGVSAERIMLTPNWSHVSAVTCDAKTFRSRYGWPAGKQIALHTGNMGLKQGLEQVIAAARLAESLHPRAHFILQGDGSRRGPLEESALGLTNLTFQSFVPDEDYGNALIAADVLLISERPTQIDMSLPGKLTSYFMSGRPILAAVPAGGATAEEILRAGAGVVVPPDEPRAFVDALRSLDRDEPGSAAYGARGKAYAIANLLPQVGTSRLQKVLLSAMTDALVG